VSFTVGEGELVALVGESGCGKTTTAQSIMAMIGRQGGQVLFRGQDVGALSPRDLRQVRSQMVMIYQDPYESLNPRFRVRDTVTEPLLIHGIGGTGDARHRRVVRALERAGLSPPDLYLNRFPHELSGGQRQRVAIAAALVLEPRLLVADEPVSMLDVSVRAGILTLLDSLRADGMGILMITHDLATAVQFADRLAVMYLGRIVEEGPPKEVVRAPRHPYTAALIAVAPRRAARAGLKRQILTGEPPNPIQVPSGCRFHPRCPVVTEPCSSIDPRLVLVGAGEVGHRAACILLPASDAGAASVADVAADG
jgi:oligopeptide/dipeptide ABC transporter ATP-binding protein